MRRRSIEIEPFFHQGRHSSLFCIYVGPTSRPARGRILYLHPFAEEMHKSRRMAALQARRFASEDFAVLQVDLTGCGDSTGDFGDARWETWLDDAQTAYQLLCERAEAPSLIWGLRLGASLAAELSTRLDEVESLLLWQPVIDGTQYVSQFLRIKTASEMLSTGKAQTGIKELRGRLAEGHSIEVGGYALSSALAASIDRLQLTRLVPTGEVRWFELSATAAGAISPPSIKVVDNWRAHGVTVCSQAITGEPFWVTQEITECPELVEATVRTLSRTGH